MNYSDYTPKDEFKETHNGMRIETFLVDSDMLSEEILEPRRCAEEEAKIVQEMIDILKNHNRLPDDDERNLSDNNDKPVILKMEAPK